MGTHFFGQLRSLSRARKVVLAVSGVVVAGALAITLAGLILFNRYHPGTQAMEPNIKPGDWIWTRPVGTLTRGEIVLLVPPTKSLTTVVHPPSLVIARVVALGRETVSASGGRLLVNGTPAQERYLAPSSSTADIPATVVPDGSVYVMDDNRENSQGSRVYGPVPVADVKERVAWIGAPSMGLLVPGAVVALLIYVALVSGLTRHRRSWPE